MWFHARDGWGGLTWPDGGAYLDQPAKLIRAFSIIAAENQHWEKLEEPRR